MYAVHSCAVHCALCMWESECNDLLIQLHFVPVVPETICSFLHNNIVMHIQRRRKNANKHKACSQFSNIYDGEFFIYIIILLIFFKNKNQRKPFNEFYMVFICLHFFIHTSMKYEVWVLQRVTCTQGEKKTNSWISAIIITIIIIIHINMGNEHA